MKKINVAVIGFGSRGRWVTEAVLLKMKDVHVAAVCDVYEDRAAAGAALTASAQETAALAFTDYRDALAVKGLDAVLIFTAWESHTEIAVAAMKAGIPVGSEVGGEYSLAACQKLVTTF